MAEYISEPSKSEAPLSSVWGSLHGKAIAWGQGALMSLEIDWKFFQTYQERVLDERETSLGKPVNKWEFLVRIRDVAKAYIQLVYFLLEQAGVDVASGTSYGFNTTRLAVYERSNLQEASPYYRGSPYVRVSVGTENAKDAYFIAHALRRANHIFTNAIREHRLLHLTTSLLKEERKIVDEI